MSKRLLRIILLLYCVNSFDATLSPTDKSKLKPKELKIKTGPLKASVFDRNLVEEEPFARDIIKESGAYNKDTYTRLFNGTTLGYVTPWNSHGYDVAKIWSQKFDIISPVWLQVLAKGSDTYDITGTHDIDQGWMAAVRKMSHGRTKIFPRILFDKFTDKQFSNLLGNEANQNAVSKLAVSVCKDFRFNGFVLEVWSQLAVRVDDEILFNLVKRFAKTLKENNYELILVIPPQREGMHDLFSYKHFAELQEHVHSFSLMTYDFSNIQRPGANAPLYWMRNTVEKIVPSDVPNYLEKRKKILMGLNFYGNDYTPDGGGPIVASQFLELVHFVKKRLSFDEKDVENYFEVKTQTGRHIVFYPTLYSINERLNLARELGVGISIWELGQGLDYFYDLL